MRGCCSSEGLACDAFAPDEAEPFETTLNTEAFQTGGALRSRVALAVLVSGSCRLDDVSRWVARGAFE